MNLMKISDFCTTGSGGTPSRSNESRYYNGDVSWVKSGELRESIIYSTEEKITQAALAESSAKLVPAGSLLVAMYGATIGRVAVLGIQAATNQAVCNIQPDPRIADARYLFYALRDKAPHWISRGAGGAQPNISQGIIKDTAIHIPPLPEQRRIADILDRADALRAKRRATLARLDELTQMLFVELIGDGDSKWPEVALPDAYWFQEGPGVRKWQFQSEGVKLLNVGNIEKSGILNLSKTDRHLSEHEAMGKYRHFLVDAGDLVMASSGISFDADGLLRTRGAFVSPEHLPLCMNTSTIRFKPIENVSDLRFLWVWIGSQEFRSQITKLVTGSAQQNFGPTHLSRLKITLPPISVQKAFANKVAKVDESKKSLNSAITLTDDLFSSLQDRAFRGAL